MKLLIVGSDKNYAIEHIYMRYLSLCGVEVHLFPAQTIFHKYYYSSLFNKLKFRLGVSRILVNINKELIREVNKIEPDFVWVFKGMEVFPKTISAIKHKHIKTLNYNPDNPFIFSGRGSGNKNVTNSIGLYDIHLTYNLEVEEIIKKKFNIPTFRLPFAYDVNERIYNSAIKYPEILKTCFIGNPDKQRVSLFKKLADNGIEIDIYGNSWDKFIEHANITTFPPIYEDEFWFTLRKYRIQMNPLRIHNVESHGMRSFEIPGIGGIMLAPYTTEHDKLFEDGKEAFFYHSPEDAIKKIRYLLSLNSDKIDLIRQNARTRSVSSGYKYENRAKEVLKILKEND